ncbi:MAG: SoxR reducing system RseC family protein [Deltaproteobacteria bacterium]|nr:SoxR reducing system RseC family protein [Deltaproteobacteria bacterium]
MAQLITKTGIVRAIHGPMAVAVTQREPECESCKARHSCEALGGSGSNVEVRARNTAGAQVGDTVTIGLRSASLLKVSFYIYTVPILALIGGMLSGYLLAKIFSLGEDLMVGIVAGLALACSFVWLGKKGRELSRRQEFTPEIIAKKSPEKTISLS